MIVDFSTEIRDDRLTVIKNRIDAGSGKGKMLFYTEPKPTPGDAITTQVRIATGRFTDPCGVVDSQNLALSFDGDIIVETNGDVNWCRVTDSDDVWVGDLDATITAENGAVKLDNLRAYEGATLRVISAGFYEP